MAETLLASTGGWGLGIDWSRPSENLDIKSLVQAAQCEYDRTDNSLRTVPGIRTVFDAGEEVESLYYDTFRQKWYYSSGQSLCATDFQTKTKLGTLTGVHHPVYHAYDGKILVASGGKLQAITGAGVLETVDDSPTCEMVSSAAGSVLLASIYDDRLYWSAIGDYKSWTNDPNDKSSAQYVDIGYKDHGKIVAVDFLSKAIIVYKEYGRVYQVIGSPRDSDFASYPLSQTGFCSGATVNVDDRSYYLGDAGLMSFAPTDTYANIQPFETGLNINAWLLKRVQTTARMWHVPNRKQIWVLPASGDEVFLYHYIPRYSDGRGVFTSRTLQYALHDVVSHEKQVYLAYGTKIAVLDELLDTDDGVQINTSIVTGNRIATRNFILIMNYNFVSHNIIEGYGTIQISNKKQKAVTFAGESVYLYDLSMPLDEWNEYMNADEYTKVFKIGGGANRSIQIKIFVQKGAISVRQFDYNYLEV